MGMRGLPHISVIVITYNQEKLIGRALDSILIQADWGLKDIIVCDDCSIDGNWQVISEYTKKYPNYIRAYRNVSNMGIYGNLQHALTYLEDTDLVYLCSGDDTFCDGLFKGAIQVIKENHIDYKRDSFAIYCDWKQLMPNGKCKIFKNNMIEKGHSALSLKLRHLISNRSCGVSMNIYRKYHPVPLNRGISVAENLFDIQVQVFSERNYYFPFVGSVYYGGIGISTKMNDRENLLSLIDSYRELLKIDCLSASDRRYLLFLIERFSYKLHKNFGCFCKVWFYYFRSIKYGFSLNAICKLMGSMLFKPDLKE